MVSWTHTEGEERRVSPECEKHPSQGRRCSGLRRVRAEGPQSGWLLPGTSEVRPPGREGGSLRLCERELDIGASHLPALGPGGHAGPGDLRAVGAGVSAGLSSPCQESCWLRQEAGVGGPSQRKRPAQDECSRSLGWAGMAQTARHQEAHHFTSCSHGARLALFSNKSNFPKEMENLKDKDK